MAVDGAAPMLQLRQGTTTIPLSTAKSTPWSIEAPLPQDLSEGKYQAWVHNGAGGEHGWANAGEVFVRVAIPPGPDHFNITDFGAVPDDEGDDSAR